MPTLPPTVHERLAQCGTRVFVDGLVPGADVELSVGGATFNHAASGGSHTFTVPAMSAGDIVRARQDAGEGFSDWSPPVEVEAVALPPNAAPRLPEAVGACSLCVWLDGLVPGCEVELFVGGDLVGSGTANRHGNGCFGTELKRVQESGAVIRARMTICGEVSPEDMAPVVPEPESLPEPVVGSPLFGCQRVVPLSNLHKGARVQLQTDSGNHLGSFCSCWTAVNVYIGSSLVVDEQVQAQAYWEGERRCEQTGPWSDWEPVVPPDERIKPTVREPLVEGDQYLRVENQISGAELLVKIRPDEVQPADEFGPRPASTEQEIALAAPLVADNVVSVVQSLCGVSVESDPVTVMPRPPVVHAPVIIPPMYECGAAVRVSNVHLGALVRIYQDDIPIGLHWAGMDSSISIPANPSLVAGGKVTAKQWVGGVESPPSDPAVEVQMLEEMLTPIILQPVAEGDTEIWVSRVPPGARVTIQSGGSAIGEAYASETIVRVSVAPVADIVRAKATLCETSRTTDRVVPIKDPCAAGSFEQIGEKVRDYGVWQVPDTTDGAEFESPIEGQLYFPADANGWISSDAINLPLVVIAHGFWTESHIEDGVEYYYDEELEDFLPVDSHKGYDYLARHLARWGMVVLSLRLDVVNRKTLPGGGTHQYARGEIILRAIDRALNDPEISNHLDDQRIGLIGHSMGGEGVVVAQHLNESEGRGFGIRGVVSIAPTHWRPEIRLRETKYMQLLGSMDLLVSGLDAVTGPHDPNTFSGVFSGFRIYDQAWRPKTHFWIYGARHNPFNRRWIAAGDDLETGWATAEGVLPPPDHERIAKCLINAFFQDALFDREAYEGYMQSIILPRSLTGLEIHPQHSSDQSRVVVDNFGDVDDQVPLAAESLDKTDNSLGQTVNSGGGGLDTWEDVEHVTLSNSPHDTKGVELSWREPNVVYTSEVGSLALTDTDFISLRIGQFFEDAALNPVAEPVDLFIQISDGIQTATVRLGSVTQAPYPDAAHTTLSVMRTVRLPLSAFQAANQLLDFGNIKSIQLLLTGRAMGHVLLDDLEFSRQ